MHMLISLLVLSLLSFCATYPVFAYIFLKDHQKLISSCVFVHIIQTLTLTFFVLAFRGLDIVETTYILTGIMVGIIFIVIYFKNRNLNKESLLFFSLYSCIGYFIIHHFLLGYGLLLLAAGYLIGFVMSIIFSTILKSKTLS